MQQHLSLVALALAIGLIGCGGNEGPPTYPVSGTVTYKGNPLVDGQIAFRPDESKGGTGPMHAADIVDGTFSVEATEGPKRVEIYGSWVVPGEFVVAPGSGKKFPKKASVPGKYNEFSKLTTTIKPSENTGVDFALE